MRGIEAEYTDDLGEMDGIGDSPLPDFLPPPDQLLQRTDTVRVILALSQSSVELFRQRAQRQGVSYERMIGALLDAYAKRHG